MEILFDSKNTEYKSPFGTLFENRPCRIRLKIPVGIGAEKVLLRIEKENGEEFASFPGEKEDEQDGFFPFSFRFSLAEPALYFYFFFIRTENGSFSLFRRDFASTSPNTGEKWQLSVIPSSFVIPSLFAGKILYQIFPDRFFQAGNPDLTDKLLPFSVHTNRHDVPDYLPNEKNEILNNDFFGGNLRGITEKLDYLASLSVGIVYLNPIFKAFSNHRYDTADYRKIDEMLGTENDFRILCEEAHRRGIRVILDGVFSHTGSNSVYFDKEGVFGSGACSDDSSPYADWYFFEKKPDRYTSWWGIPTLPCVDENNESFRTFLLRGEDCVIAKWLKAGADGFRLDVADELPDSFIAELRMRMKAIKPDALLLGEVWEDASNKCSYGERRRYFTGGELDSVMNYPLREAILALFEEKDDGRRLYETLLTLEENYPHDVFHTLMNPLSTHDTPRILSLIGQPDPPSEKGERALFRLPPAQYSLAEKKVICAFFLLFSLPGMPTIYYGDEIGMQGYEDPFCRGFFEWERIEGNRLLAFVRQIAALRTSDAALQKGEIVFPPPHDRLLLFFREKDGERRKIALNLSQSEKRISKSGTLLIGTENVKENVDSFLLPPLSALILAEN